MITYETHPNSNLIIAVLHNEVTYGELSDHIKHLNYKVDDNIDMRVLVVLCDDVKESDLDFKCIFDMKRQLHLTKGIKIALVAKTIFGYGMARMFQGAISSGASNATKVYNNDEFAEAVDWLSIEQLDSEYCKAFSCNDSLLDVQEKQPH